MGRSTKKNCRLRGIPVEPPTKKPRLDPSIGQSTAPKPVWGELEAHNILEKQAEDAYEEYKSVVNTIPAEQGQALYLKYQTLYKAYEAAYLEHMEKSRGDDK